MALATVRRNLGKTKQNVNVGLIKGAIVTPEGFSLSASNKLLKAQWQTALFDTVANRIHLLPKFNEMTDESEKIIIYDTDLGSQFVRFGRRKFDVSVTKSFYLHQAIQTYSGAVAKIILIDTNNKFWGVVDSAGNFSGFTIELFQSESLIMNSGKEPSLSKIKIALSDSLELDVQGGYVDAGAFYNQLKELVDVNVVQSGVVAGTNVKVTVTVDADGSSVDGLANVVPDFLVKSAAGVARVVTAVTQDLSVTPGVYSLTVTALTAGDTVNLTTPALLSIPGYESTGAIVTV